MAAVTAVTNVLWGCSVNFSWQIPQCGVRANLCIDVVQSLAGAALAFSSFVDTGPAEHKCGDGWDLSSNHFLQKLSQIDF